LEVADDAECAPSLKSPNSSRVSEVPQGMDRDGVSRPLSLTVSQRKSERRHVNLAEPGLPDSDDEDVELKVAALLSFPCCLLIAVEDSVLRFCSAAGCVQLRPGCVSWW
jgi:hypothetical protein